MTAATTTTEKKLNNSEEFESVDRSDDEIEILHKLLDQKWFLIVSFVSFDILWINMVVTLSMYSWSIMKLIGWKRSFSANYTSDIQIEYDQMFLSLHLHTIFFLIIVFLLIISLVGFRGLIKLLRETSLIGIIIGYIIIVCLIIIIYDLLKSSNTENILLQNDCVLPQKPISLLAFKLLCIIGSIQHILLISIVFRFKPKNFHEIFDDDDDKRAKVVNKEKQIISKKQEEIEKICENYVLC